MKVPRARREWKVSRFFFLPGKTNRNQFILLSVVDFFLNLI